MYSQDSLPISFLARPVERLCSTKYTDDCKQKEKECGENCLLLSILKDNFYFLHQKLGYYSETILYPLREVPCIPVCVDGNMSNIKQAVLVYPLQVITEGKECKEARPFINPLPDVLFLFSRDVLSKIGVKSTIQPIHVRKALETVHDCIKHPLDPNIIQVVQYLLKQLYLLLKDGTDTEKHADSLSRYASSPAAWAEVGAPPVTSD